jgi:predicted alpha/beta-fold hydrolase
VRRCSGSFAWRTHTHSVAHGGSVRVDEWAADNNSDRDVDARFVVVVVPGIGGSSEQQYVRALVRECAGRGWRVAVFNHRGCGSQALTSPHLFTFGDVDDLAVAMRELARRHPRARFGMVGCSMGANLLVNYLALDEKLKGHVPIAAAVSLCQAFDARRANDALAPQYAKILLGKMQKLIRLHADVIAQHEELDVDAILAAKGTNEFDDLYTVRLHRRWRDANHYYDEASCLPKLKTVRIPTLLFNAADDPLVPAALVEDAREQARTNRFLAVALSDVGGHLGHAAGFLVPDDRSFADHVIGEFFAEFANEL